MRVFSLLITGDLLLVTVVHLFSENSRSNCKYLLQGDEEKSEDRETRKDYQRGSRISVGNWIGDQGKLIVKFSIPLADSCNSSIHIT